MTTNNDLWSEAEDRHGSADATAAEPLPDEELSGTFVDRYLRLSAAERSSINLFIGIRVAFFLFVLTVIVVLVGDAGVLEGDGLNPFTIFYSADKPLANLNVNTGVTFLSDLPSLVLALTSTSGLVTYCVLGRFRKTFLKELCRTGLVDEKVDGLELRGRFSEMLARTSRRRWQNWAVLALSLGIGTFFYWQTKNYGYMFVRLSELSGGTVSAEQFSANWWAAKNLFLAAGWVLLGSFGFWSAIMQGWDYLKITNLCVDLGERGLLNHVPLWVSAQYGWRPVTRLVDLKVVGFVTGLIATLPVAYLLYGHQPYRVIIVAVLILLFAVWNFFQLRVIARIPRIHRRIVDQRLQLVRERINRLAPHLGDRIPELPRLSGTEYAELHVWLGQADQLNAAIDVRMYKYMRAAALYGPFIGSLYVAGAVITILTLF